jgi:hypothetical protein
MRVRSKFMMSWVVLAIVTACANVQVQDRQILVDEKAPRPGHIFVYDFIATPEDVPSDSSLAGHATAGASPQTPEQIALGREIGTELANALVAEIAAMGLPGEHATSETEPEGNDLVIRGTLLSVVEGSATERVAIGMGEGAAELKVAVEGYQMTDHGLRKVGSGTLDTNASKTPGAAVPLVVAIATKNPLGLIVSTGVKLHGEETGSSTIHGKAKDVAKEIAAQLRPRFEKQGWIAPSGSAP